LAAVTEVGVDYIPAGESLVLDTSTVIAYLNASESVSPNARHLFEAVIGSKRNPAVISSITVAEVLVPPIRDLGRVPGYVKTFLLDFPGLSVRSADFLVAAEAADIRARTGAALSDALIAATATLTSSRWLITNDHKLRDRLDGLEWDTSVVLLSELTPA
jgi:predicted nucleic acid-binding protein